MNAFMLDSPKRKVATTLLKTHACAWTKTLINFEGTDPDNNTTNTKAKS